MNKDSALGDPSYNSQNEDDDSDCESWMAEDFEGPNDDDIFVERPEDHSQQEFGRIRVLMRENASAVDTNQPDGKEWYSDVESDSDGDLDSLKGSDDEDVGYDMANFEMKVGMQFPNRATYREVLRDWVVRKGWDLSIQKCERDKITAI